MEDDFDQLDDLEQGYRRLLEQNYHFAEKDIEARFQEVRDAIRANSSELVTLILIVLVMKMNTSKKIDSLYELFEREIAAHKLRLKTVKLFQIIWHTLKPITKNWNTKSNACLTSIS